MLYTLLKLAHKQLYQTSPSLLSSSMSVLDSRDQQGNIQLSQNAPKLTSRTMLLTSKTNSKTVLVQYVITAKNIYNH